MAGSRRFPLIMVEGREGDPNAGGGDPTAPDSNPLFHVEDSDTTGIHPHDPEMGSLEGVSGKREQLNLQQEQQADNPMDLRQVSGQPDLERMPDPYEVRSVPSHSYGVTRGQSQQAYPNNPSNPPLRASETLSAAALRARGHLRRATTSMRDGVKHASVHVAYAGEQVGKAWNKTLDSAMGVCVVCGGLAIILLAIAASLRSWRYQHLTYSDTNGFNTSRVEMGLDKLQRIQTLNRANDAGDVYMYDEPISYRDAMTSAYCIPQEDPPTEPTPEAPGTPETPGPQEPYPPEPPAPEAEPTQPSSSDGDLPPSFMGRILKEKPKAVVVQRAGPLASPPPYSVTFGRNPGAPGGLEDRFVEMREILLGATVFDIQCGDLHKFKSSGALFIRMSIAYVVFAGVGMICAIFAIIVAPMTQPWCIYMQKMPINLLGTIAWVVALVLQLIAIAAWGVGTDVAACVTQEGGASVCNLGVATALTIGSLVLTLVATLCYSIFFTHKFIRDLGLEKEREQRLREASERRQSVDLITEGSHPDLQPHAIFNTEGSQGPPQGGSQGESQGGPQGGARGAPLGGPHPPAEGESDSPIRSITDESNERRDSAAVKNPEAY